jgi:flagellar P-ring protein FlgI
MRVICAILLAMLVAISPSNADSVRLKDLGRFQGWRDNALVGYGIVTGLAGSGDSPRSEVTRQALSNALSRLGSSVPADLLQSRNVAAVMIVATLPPSANIGDRIDVTVTSIGDARSLAGGTLLMTPLIGPDQKTYALAQGSLVVGGFRFDADFNVRQKNYPTSGTLPGGATVELGVSADVKGADGVLTFLLKNPDFSTAQNVADRINQQIARGLATVESAEAIRIGAAAPTGDIHRLIARIENVMVEPDQVARIVVNERSGTVVAGVGVTLSSVVIAQGDIKVAVSVDREGMQPFLFGSSARDARGLVVTNTKLEVNEERDAVVMLPNTTVADLVQALSRARVTTRDMIAILQAMKAAGALHADILVQ